mgnify:CR=1 FL=1
MPPIILKSFAPDFHFPSGMLQLDSNRFKCTLKSEKGTNSIIAVLVHQLHAVSYCIKAQKLS